MMSHSQVSDGHEFWGTLFNPVHRGNVLSWELVPPGQYVYPVFLKLPLGMTEEWLVEKPKRKGKELMRVVKGKFLATCLLSRFLSIWAEWMFGRTPWPASWSYWCDWYRKNKVLCMKAIVTSEWTCSVEECVMLFQRKWAYWLYCWWDV